MILFNFSENMPIDLLSLLYYGLADGLKMVIVSHTMEAPRGARNMCPSDSVKPLIGFNYSSIGLKTLKRYSIIDDWVCFFLYLFWGCYLFTIRVQIV